MIRVPIPIRDALDYLGIEQGRHRLHCPRSKCEGRSPTLSVSYEKNVWHCFRCEIGGGAAKLAAVVWRCTVDEADARLRAGLGLARAGSAAALLQSVDRLEGGRKAGRTAEDVRREVEARRSMAGLLEQEAHRVGLRLDLDGPHVRALDALLDGEADRALDLSRRALDLQRRACRALGVPEPPRPTLVGEDRASRRLLARVWALAWRGAARIGEREAERRILEWLRDPTTRPDRLTGSTRGV